MTYDDFILSKIPAMRSHGFDPALPLNAHLFPWQAKVTAWAIKQGRSALFADCGLGKTLMQLERATQVCKETGASVLILAPLAVAAQTVAEGEKFGIAVTHCREPEQMPAGGIGITNYDRLENFTDIIPQLAGVVLDESSILKSFMGKTRRRLTELFSKTPYRLACTATPAPNDFMEFGQHAEFLGILKSSEMLATWFINDTYDTGTWRLKSHARDDFWRWVCSWAACISKPSDIGFDDNGFVLPPLEIREIRCDAPDPEPLDGELFGLPSALSAIDIRREKRRTLDARSQAAAEFALSTDESVIVWCDLNDEADALIDLLPAAEMVEVRGSDRPEHKETKLNLFSRGERRIIVTKPSIAGFGLNWQHCRNIVFVGVSYSFEAFYQAVRRCYRFGQKQEVRVLAITTDTDAQVFAVLRRKMEQHETMHSEMRRHAADFLAEKSPIIMKQDVDHESSEHWTLYHADCVRAAKEIESESIGFSVFSPPFADLFTYSADSQDMGNCRNVDQFMVQFGFLIDELSRVTMPGRECAVHCCDLLSTKWKDGAIELKDFSGEIVRAFRSRGWLFHSRITVWKSPVTEMQRTKAHGLLYKTLQKDAADSRVGAPDYLLCFRKPGVNPVPIAHTPQDFPLDKWQEIASPVWWTVDQGRVLNGACAREQGDERHICPLQLDIIERALFLWSAPGDLVFSPFAGIGSEGYSAVRMGRKFVGCELKESYFDHACDNLRMAENERHDLFSAVA